MSAAISQFINLPGVEIKRKAVDDQSEGRKRQRLEAPNQEEEYLEPLSPSILTSSPYLENSPVKKKSKWSDPADQAKAIDSIKRALVQISTNYKKENMDPNVVDHTQPRPLLSDKPRVVLANVTPNNPTRGSLTNQQRWRDDQFQNPTCGPAERQEVAPYFDQRCRPCPPAAATYNNCYPASNYTGGSSTPNASGVFKHEKTISQYQYQPYPSPPRAETDMMYTNMFNNWGSRQQYPPTTPSTTVKLPNEFWNINEQQQMDECLSPTEDVLCSNPTSPESDDMKPKFFQPVQEYQMQPIKFHPMDSFCNVPGRLSLLSGASKYNVTIGEVQRRLTYPESLNVSLLGGVLRRAKAKNGNHVLRTQLEERGITIPTGRRKAASVSLFTSLLEGESAQLANDFSTLCEKFFPCRELAKSAIINDAQRYPSEEQMRRVMNTKQMIGDLQELMEVSVVKNNDVMNNHGVTGHGMAPCPQLMTFELLTHGFGASALSAAFNVVQTYLDEMLKSVSQQQ